MSIFGLITTQPHNALKKKKTHAQEILDNEREFQRKLREMNHLRAELQGISLENQKYSECAPLSLIAVAPSTREKAVSRNAIKSLRSQGDRSRRRRGREQLLVQTLTRARQS